ncbi:MAG: peptidoglycan editing factor PgeF [Campylobacterota bacterium]|nr:peptidoglycan editing factor PgeF [Campylobacterota bacterium]
MINNKKIKVIFTSASDGNIAYHVTNDKIGVDYRREELASKYDFDITNLKYMDQIHSNIVKKVDNKNLYEKCDAIVTDQKDLPLMVMVADCIPIIFYDSKKGVAAAAHAGREGTLNNISSNVIEMMVDQFRCKPKDIKVILGPSIQKCCYEVSAKMASDISNRYGQQFANGRYIDLQAINKEQLLEKKIDENNIDISPICTKCGCEDYFSYRNEKNCGRFAAIVILK